MTSNGCFAYKINNLFPLVVHGLSWCGNFIESQSHVGTLTLKQRITLLVSLEDTKVHQSCYHSLGLARFLRKSNPIVTVVLTSYTWSILTG